MGQDLKANVNNMARLRLRKRKKKILSIGVFYFYTSCKPTPSLIVTCRTLNPVATEKELVNWLGAQVLSKIIFLRPIME